MSIPKTFLVLIGATLLAGCAAVPPVPKDDLRPLLESGSRNFDTVLAQAADLRVQILISEPFTNRTGKVALRRHGFRVGAEYFYPASTVKLCAAVAALQTIEALRTSSSSPDLLEAPLEIAPLFPGDPPQIEDPSNREHGRITVGQEIRKISLVSDNRAFNRLFDLVGHEQLNRSMHELGLHSVVINHRLSETRTIPEPLASAAVTFRGPGTAPIAVPARLSRLSFTNPGPRLQIGSGHLRNGVRVDEPMDFARRNGISLLDLQDLVVKVARPDIELGTPKLNLTDAHRRELLRAMTEYPRESTNPIYDPEKYADDYTKFLLPGVRRVFPAPEPGRRIESTGKLGQAYGFSIENSYLHNPANGRSVFVTAVLYTNSDGILNDDRYDYQTVALPFMADLGEFVARRWLATPSRP